MKWGTWPSGGTHALDDFCNSLDSVAARFQLSRRRCPDPPLAGHCSRGPDHQRGQWASNSLIFRRKRKCFMKKYATALLTLSVATFAFAGPSQQDPTARLQAAGQVMKEIMAAPDKGIPEEVLNGAKCIAVVPDMAKGA